jgi:hypothetical protein
MDPAILSAHISPNLRDCPRISLYHCHAQQKERVRKEEHKAEKE